MPLIVLVVVAILVFWGMFAILGSVVQVLLMLLMAGVVGWLADLIVPGELPYGWIGAVGAGLVGSWLGTAFLGHIGPQIFGIPFIPALAGAIVLALGIELAGRALGRSRAA